MTGFAYVAILGVSGEGPPAGLAAVEEPGQGGVAVWWDHVARGWRAGSAPAIPLLSDPRNAARRVRVDRGEAERIAREHLGADLPDEAELWRINQAPGPLGSAGPAEEREDVDLANEDWLRPHSWRDSGGNGTSAERP